MPRARMRPRPLPIRSLALRLAVGAGLLLAASTGVRAQTPAEELDARWTAICAGAVPGTTFATRCAEILEAGPGLGNRRSAAAEGNNLDTLGAQGRLARQRREEPAVSLAGKLNVYLTAFARPGGWRGTSFEQRYDDSGRGALVGADLPLGARGALGAALSFSRDEGEFTAGAGRIDADTVALTLYADAAGERARWGVHAGYGRSDYDLLRTVRYDLVLNAGQPDETRASVDGIARAQADASQLTAGVHAGFDAVRGGAWFGPVVRVDWVRMTVDPYQETGGAGLSMRFDERRSSSLRGEAGLEFSFATSLGGGVLSPQFYAAYAREFADDRRATVGRFNGDTRGTPVPVRTQEPDRNFVRAGASLSAVFPRGFVLLLDVDATIAHRYEYGARVSLGLRKEF